MSRETFLELFKVAFRIGATDVRFETQLDDLPEWDSLAKITLISFFDAKFKLRVGIEEVNRFKSIQDVYDRVGGTND